MAYFAYNNANNANTNHILFEFNCNHHPYTTYRKNVNLYFQSKSANKLAKKLKNLITVCRKNLYHV